MNMNELLNSPSTTCGQLQITRELPRSAAAFTVKGNCMEGRQIFDGDTVLVDLDRKPRAGDPCLCIVNGKPMFKIFRAVVGNSRYSVGTCYNNQLNRGFFTEEIGGVVIGCFAKDGSARWLKDYKTFPKTLPAASCSSLTGNACFA